MEFFPALAHADGFPCGSQWSLKTIPQLKPGKDYSFWNSVHKRANIQLTYFLGITENQKKDQNANQAFQK